MDKAFLRNCLRIARNLAPMDSGNLRYNAINIRNIKENEFTINYSARQAYYLNYVEEGTRFQEGQHFIKKTRLILSEYAKDYYNGNRKAYRRYVKGNKVPDNFDVALKINNKSVSQYRVLRELNKIERPTEYRI